MKGTFRRYPGAVPAKVCDQIIALGEAKKLEPAKVYTDQGAKEEAKQDLRRGLFSFFDDPLTTELAKELVTDANFGAGWDAAWGGFAPAQYSVYTEGDHFDWHSDDVFAADEIGRFRKLSLGLALNDGAEYGGGDFYIRNLQDPYDQKGHHVPEMRFRGCVVVFPSFAFHKVTRITSGTRRSLVMWAMGPKWL